MVDSGWVGVWGWEGVLGRCVWLGGGGCWDWGMGDGGERMWHWGLVGGEGVQERRMGLGVSLWSRQGVIWG